MDTEKQASAGTSDSSVASPANPGGKLSAEGEHLLTAGAPPFAWSSLWSAPKINHLNGKSYTLPIFNLKSQYAINFHLAWLGFFVAFLSWFAFPPLIPEAIKSDLKLTTAQIGNSNVVALLATLVVRIAIGPMVDRYGPRRCMAVLLVAGAIPSGLAGTIKNASGLYTIRFFIGILGGTFVPCQAWTTLFYDKNVVGAANALVGGWGNLGGGVTFVVQVSLFAALVKDGLSSHSAWRAAFAIVPVPILFFVAGMTMWIGTDCPAGKWSDRHTLPASAVAAKMGHLATLDPGERAVVESKMAEKEQGPKSNVVEAEEDSGEQDDIDIAVNEHLTWKSAVKIITSPYTLLPSLMYMTTFGYELAVDANLANVYFASHASLGQLNAGYYASIFGFLNIVTRPMGGFLGDYLYRRFGNSVKSKKYLTVILGFLQGCMSLGLGLYSKHAYAKRGGVPALSIQLAFVCLSAVFCEMANGANFSLVPHCNSFNNGMMSGIVGGMGNLGGVWFALMFRFNPTHGSALAWVSAGAFAMGVNALCVLIPCPKH